MLTIDASVWVNGFDQREVGHETSREFLDAVSRREVPIVVPNLLLIEVAAAISRTRGDRARAEAFADALGRLPNVSFRTLDESCSSRAVALAAQHQLRGADAVYAAVAVEAGTTLVSLDNEHVTRLGSIMTVQTPSDALASLDRDQAE